MHHERTTIFQTRSSQTSITARIPQQSCKKSPVRARKVRAVGGRNHRQQGALTAFLGSGQPPWELRKQACAAEALHSQICVSTRQIAIPARARWRGFILTLFSFIRGSQIGVGQTHAFWKLGTSWSVWSVTLVPFWFTRGRMRSYSSARAWGWASARAWRQEMTRREKCIFPLYLT